MQLLNDDDVLVVTGSSLCRNFFMNSVGTFTLAGKSGSSIVATWVPSTYQDCCRPYIQCQGGEKKSLNTSCGIGEMARILCVCSSSQGHTQVCLDYN